MENPNQGYRDPEKEKQAEEVRELIYKANSLPNEESFPLRKRAYTLSKELKNYLYDNYTFELEEFHIPYFDEIHNLLELRNSEDIIKRLNEYIDEESISFKELENHIHYIGLIYTDMNRGDKENYRYSPLFTIFVDEEGIHIHPISNELWAGTNDYPRLEMPKHFYEFLETMGLILISAVALYEIDDIMAPRHFIFAPRKGLWPDNKGKNKL
jgi:hypothetical protein